MILDSLGNAAKVGMHQMVGPFTSDLCQTLASSSQSIGVFVKAVQMTVRSEAFQDRRRMSAAAQRAIDVAAIGDDGQLLKSLPEQDRQMGKLKDRGHRNG